MSRIANLSLTALLLVGLAGCGGGAAQSPAGFDPAFAQDGNSQGLRSAAVDPLLGKLKESKISLLDGIRQAESTQGFVVSAKFEMDGDNLMLSVYTAKDGRAKDALNNILQELNGPATDPTWNPGLEVFADRDHIANSAMHLTLMQTSKATLTDVLKEASYYKKGTVYSAIPQIRDGKGLVDVKIATPDGKSMTVTYDLRAGSVVRN